MEARERRSFSDDAGYVVGLALLVILFVNAGAGAVVAKVASNGRVKADHADYVEFSRLYLTTFLLSVTLTIAVALFAVPRIYGRDMHWAVPVGVVIIGGYLTGLPVRVPTAAQTHNPKVWLVAWGVDALQTFARYYGTAFFGGTVVGLAGGLLLALAAHHHRGTAPPTTGDAAIGHRPPRPWGAEVAVLVVAILIAAYAVSAIPVSAGAAALNPNPTVARTPAPVRPTRPAPAARFTNVTWGSVDSQRQAPYHLEITFTGLRGESCRVTWWTVYLPSGAAGDTSGEVWTGALPYDDDNWWIDRLMVTAPSGGHRWGTHFSVSCHGVLMASR
jgi:hypothetical protein